MPSPHGKPLPHCPARLTAATEAYVIIREEMIATKAAERSALSDDELRRCYAAYRSELITRDGQDIAAYLPDPAIIPCDEMIEFLSQKDSWAPPTFAIPQDADDPLVLSARELRRDSWERNLASTIRSMGLVGPAIDRHRATAEREELDFLCSLVEETWSLSEVDLRNRASEIVAKLTGGAAWEDLFADNPATLSRGELLAAIANYIEGRGARVVA
jgi:hypothetical protein